MTDIQIKTKNARPLKNDPRKFQDPNKTVKGETRASVALNQLETLWINTGTLCNIACANCYIHSSPTNDSLVYISLNELISCLDEIKALELDTKEIGFTGGEPFLNPDMPAMAKEALERGFNVLILTNAMRPMQRPKIQHALLELNKAYPGKLSLRVSLDHYSQQLHETERGPKTWESSLKGLDWLSQNDFNIAIAGRTCWSESEDKERGGYAALIETRNWAIDPHDPAQLVLFPEMDEQADVPEISSACWEILQVDPNDMMCATSRMVVKHKGSEQLSFMPCTLISHAKEFDMGSNLKDALHADSHMFDAGAVKLCHVHCAKFCVLGGGKCSA